MEVGINERSDQSPGPNNAPERTAAAMLVSRRSLSRNEAAAAELQRSAKEVGGCPGQGRGVSDAAPAAHSALEQYLQITGQKPADIELANKARQSDRLIAEILDSDDRDPKLFDFLHRRLNKHLQES